MMMALLAALLLVGAFAISRPSAHTYGSLTKGQLYRVWAHVPADYVATMRGSSPSEGQKMLLADVQARLEAAGFTGTLLVTQDPTDNRIVTALSRWGKSSDPSSLDTGPVDIYRLEPVEEPPPLTTAPYEPPPASLDEGLTPGEVAAIKQALATDDDVKHLTGFAATLEPYFPIAASLLRAKAAILSAKPAVAGEKLAEQRNKLAERLIAATDAVGWFGPESESWTETKSIPANALVARTRDLGPAVAKGFLRQASSKPERWHPITRVAAIEDALGTAKAMQTATSSIGGVPLEEADERFVAEIRKAHPIFSLVPRPGSGVLGMFIAAPALALSQPLPMKLDALASTLPKTMQAVYRSGLEAGRSSVLTKGPRALAQLQVRQDLPSRDAIVFDLGLCLGRAKALQEAGFRDSYHATRGKDLAARAADFSTALTQGILRGTSVQNALAEQRAADLRRRAEGGSNLETLEKLVKQLAIEAVKDGAFMRQGALEDKFKVSSDIASAARSIVEELGPGIRVINAERLKRLVPPRGLEHFVSPGALQLAMAAGLKREGSNVTIPDRVGARISQVKALAQRGRGAAGDKARRAHEELVRAKKTLERQRWVEWYRKNREG